MSNEIKTSQDASVAGDLEEVSRQLTALREDMATLAKTVTGIAGRRGSDIASDIAEGLEEARHYAGRTSRSAEAQIEDSVATHPFLAIGLAVGVGLLIGTLSRR